MITGNAQDIAAVMAMTNELSMLIGQLKGENEYLKRRVAELERVTAGREAAAPQGGVPGWVIEFDGELRIRQNGRTGIVPNPNSESHAERVLYALGRALAQPPVAAAPVVTLSDEQIVATFNVNGLDIVRTVRAILAAQQPQE